MTLSRAVVAEGLGTALLLAVVVGSGIMGERLAGGNVAVALLANSLATGAGLIVLILIFGPISGAHFNPVVSMAQALRGELKPKTLLSYIAVQVVGACVGVFATHLMFAEPILQTSVHIRTGGGQWWSECVATFGLLATIFGVSRRTPTAVPYAVGLSITAAYWFTASTSFANPAVTVARSLTDTFAGIRAIDAPAFIVAQIVGAGLGLLLFRWIGQDGVEQDAVHEPVDPRQLAGNSVFNHVHNGKNSRWRSHQRASK